MHPRIGILCREGATVFYAYLAGGLYVENTSAEELEAYIAAEERLDLRFVIRRTGTEDQQYAIAMALSAKGEGWLSNLAGVQVFQLRSNDPAASIRSAKLDGLTFEVVCVDGALIVPSF